MNLPRLTWFRAVRFVLVFVLVYSLVFLGGLAFNAGSCRLLRPLFALQLELAALPGSEVSLHCDRPTKADLRLEVSLVVPRVLPDGSPTLRGRKDSIDLLPLLQNTAVLAALILAWPGCPLRRRLLLLPGVLAGLHGLFSLDMALNLAADTLPPVTVQHHLVQAWAAFSAHGGRVALLLLLYGGTLGLLLRRGATPGHASAPLRPGERPSTPNAP